MSKVGVSIALVSLGTAACSNAEPAPSASQQALLAWDNGTKYQSKVRGAFDRFGWSVGLSGETAIVGSPRDENDTGAAYIFERDETGWTQKQKLLSDEPTLGFGTPVAISGNTALVGANFSGSGGSVFVFVREAGTWAIQAQLIPGDSTNNKFGESVAIDGDTVAIGAIWDDDLFHRGGAAYVFTRTGATWSLQEKLTHSPDNANVGTAIAVSGDTLLVSSEGAADVFVRSAGDWSFQQQLHSSTRFGARYFGRSVALEDDMAAVGVPTDDEIAPAAGSVDVFLRTGDVWSAGTRVRASDGTRDSVFGSSVALAQGQLVVGADNENQGRGAVYVFDRSDAPPSSWVEHKLVAPARTAGDRFGYSVAKAGGNVLVGAPEIDLNPGAFYAFAAACETDADCPADRRCAANGWCEASTALGGPCAEGAECGSGHCAEGVCCDTAAAACSGCLTCATGVCLLSADQSCQPTLALGEPCVTAEQCESGQCADGVCCDTACEGQCEACAEPKSAGNCQPVAGAPRGERGACGGRGACAGACDGSTAEACSFPEAGTPCDATCRRGRAQVSVCDGQGLCEVTSTTNCAPFACTQQLSCATSCEDNSKCATGYACIFGRCELPPEPEEPQASDGSSGSASTTEERPAMDAESTSSESGASCALHGPPRGGPGSALALLLAAAARVRARCSRLRRA